ncbi:MAG: YbjN domain-containing protein [Polyangia bacterium]
MASQSDSSISRARRNTERVLRSLGIDPARSEIEAPGGGAAWHVTRGSADVMVAINPAAGEQAARLRMVSPIVRLPYETPPAALQRLLELNAGEMPGVAFGILAGKVVLVAERSVNALDREEIAELLQLIGHLADKYDDELAEEFEGTRVCDDD